METRQLAQLQILHKARGRQIEELTQKLQTVQDDAGRDIRILEHKNRLIHGLVS